jgi:tetratricopeptide (TPR) repeat protein
MLSSIDSEARPVRALKDFEEAIRLDPTNAEAYTGRGLIRVHQGEPGKALDDVRAALHHGGDEPAARLLWNVAHVYAQLGAESGQAAQTEKATKRSPCWARPWMP